MANEVLKALFTAEETISDALENIRTSAIELDPNLENIDETLEELGRTSLVSNDAVEELQKTFHEVDAASERVQDAVASAARSMRKFERGTIEGDKAAEELRDAFNVLQTATESADQSVEKFDRTIAELHDSGMITTEVADELQRQIDGVGRASGISEKQIAKLARQLSSASVSAKNASNASEGMQKHLAALAATSDLTEQQLMSLGEQMHDYSLSGEVAEISTDRFQRALNILGTQSNITGEDLQALLADVLAVGGAQDAAGASANHYARGLANMNGEALEAIATNAALATSVDRAEESIADFRNSSIEATGALALLNSTLKDSILEFGSLSVNIGPFNLALRNFVTQVPAILTGMGSMLALVTSLITAFITLGAVSGALVVGGALAFFEDFSKQFEETGQAIEAMTAALKDLFVDALEPLMTEANMDLFIDTINAAASMVNRFAQFVSQMREEVMSTLGEVEGDLDDFFNAMRNTFILLEPVIKGFINFFLQDLPVIMERFAVLTATIDSDVTTLIHAFGGLLNQLLDFASSILSGLAPAISILVSGLTAAFVVLNSMPDGLVGAIVFLGIFAIVIAKTIALLAGLVSTAISVNAALITQASAGTFLGSVYGVLNAQLAAYVSGQKSLQAALAASKAAILTNASASLTNLKAKVLENNIVLGLQKAYKGLISWISATTTAEYLQAAADWSVFKSKTALATAIYSTISAYVGETIATYIATAAMYAYAAASSVAAGATWALTGAVAALTSPLWGTVALVALVIGLFLQLFGIVDFAGGFMDFLKGIASWLGDIVGQVMKLLGLTGKMDGGISGINDDAIQTESAVDLSFEDKIEQQVDVQADPEDKEGLRRIVKDAMNEANSLARRQEGLGR